MRWGYPATTPQVSGESTKITHVGPARCQRRRRRDQRLWRPAATSTTTTM